MDLSDAGLYRFAFQAVKRRHCPVPGDEFVKRLDRRPDWQKEIGDLVRLYTMIRDTSRREQAERDATRLETGSGCREVDHRQRFCSCWDNAAAIRAEEGQ